MAAFDMIAFGALDALAALFGEAFAALVKYMLDEAVVPFAVE